MILNVISFNLKIPIKKGEYKKHYICINDRPRIREQTRKYSQSIQL